MTEKPPLYTYRKREPTEDELAQATQMLAEGKSMRAIGKALQCSPKRAKRICDMIEVQKNAIRLRETDMIPNTLQSLSDAVVKLHENSLVQTQTLMRLETGMRQMNKALYRKKMENSGLRERVKKQKSDIAILKAAMRKRGMDIPDLNGSV